MRALAYKRKSKGLSLDYLLLYYDFIYSINISVVVLIVCSVSFLALLGLDPFLLILAQSGMFVYCMFSLIGSHHTQGLKDSVGLTGFFSEFLSLNQVNY